MVSRSFDRRDNSIVPNPFCLNTSVWESIFFGLTTGNISSIRTAYSQNRRISLFRITAISRSNLDRLKVSEGLWSSNASDLKYVHQIWWCGA
jgi:hypothetical protein